MWFKNRQINASDRIILNNRKKFTNLKPQSKNNSSIKKKNSKKIGSDRNNKDKFKLFE